MKHVIRNCLVLMLALAPIASTHADDSDLEFMKSYETKIAAAENETTPVVDHGKLRIESAPTGLDRKGKTLKVTLVATKRRM